MKKLLIPLSILLVSCEKTDILPIAQSVVIDSSPKKKEFRYDTLTSNEVRLSSTRWDNFNGKGLIGYADLNNDGEDDVIYIDGGVFIRIYKNGVYESFKVEGVSFIFARSIIPFDINGDNLLDFVVLAHNDEKLQFNPGEVPYVFINKGNNQFDAKKLNTKQDFWHLGTAGDLDGDGDNDLIICTAGSVSYFKNVGGELIETANVIPSKYKDSHYVGALIDDFNNDGINDVIFFGHEYAILKDKSQIALTRIMFGNKSGIFTEENSITLNEDKIGFGVIIDALCTDLDGDGKKEIILVRTGDPINFSFYKGYRVQILNQPIDVTSQFIDNPYSYSEGWICMIKLVDVNKDGKRDIVELDKRREKYFLQK